MYKLKPTKLHFQFDQADQFERSYLMNAASRSFNNSSSMHSSTFNAMNDLNQEAFISPMRSNHFTNKSFNAQLQTKLQSTNKKTTQYTKPSTNEVDYYDEIDYDNEQIISHPHLIQSNSNPKPKLVSSTLSSLSSSKLKKLSSKVNACLKLSTKTVLSANSSKVNPPMPPKQPPPCKQHRRRSCSSSTHSAKLNTSTSSEKSTHSSVSFRSFSRSNCNSPVFFRKTSSSSSFNGNTRANLQDEPRSQQMNSTILSFYSLNDSSMPVSSKCNKSKCASSSNKSSSDSGISSSRDDSSFISSSLSSSSIPSSRRSSPSFFQHHQQHQTQQTQQFQPIENTYHTLIDMKHSPFPQVKTCFVAQIKQATPKPGKLLPKVNSPFSQKNYSINDVLGSIKLLGLDYQDQDDAICDEEVQFYLNNYEQQQQQLNNSQRIVYRTLWEHLV